VENVSITIYIIISIIVCKIRIDNSLLIITIITYSKIELSAKNTYELHIIIWNLENKILFGFNSSVMIE